MAANKDWFPGTRDEQLTMGKNWVTILQTQKSAWGIPDSTFTTLSDKVTAAETALTAAKNEETRTPVATAQCKTAFEELAAVMRDIKKRFFYEPPLTNADIISLGLKPHDTTPTATGAPTAQVTVETFLKGRHELGIKIIYVTGTSTDPANKGYRIWYTVVGQGESAPANPDDLRKSFFTKRKKDIIEFDFDASGKNAWFAVQIENEGKKGPWGPLTNWLIP
jgi:hypothetical protein